jgi:hypothetical protein
LAFASAAAALRPHASVTALVTGATLWLRGDAMTPSLDRDLSRLAPAARYSVTTAGLLVPHGRSLPVAALPTGAWSPITDILAPAAPPSLLPAEPPEAVSLRLIRAYGERLATILLTSLDALARWADDAPAARLHRLRFAASATHAIVWGDPLPPLPGQRYHESAGIALPGGYAFSPAIDAPSLRKLLGLGEDEVALFAQDASYHRIPAGAFVHARRSAVRLTADAARGAALGGEGAP